MYTYTYQPFPRQLGFMMYWCTLDIQHLTTLPILPGMVSPMADRISSHWMLINENCHFRYFVWSSKNPYGIKNWAFCTSWFLKGEWNFRPRLERRKYMNRGVTQPEPFVFNTPTRSQSRHPSMPKADELGVGKWVEIIRKNGVEWIVFQYKSI